MGGARERDSTVHVQLGLETDQKKEKKKDLVGWGHSDERALSPSSVSNSVNKSTFDLPYLSKSCGLTVFLCAEK